MSDAEGNKKGEFMVLERLLMKAEKRSIKKYSNETLVAGDKNLHKIPYN